MKEGSREKGGWRSCDMRSVQCLDVNTSAIIYSRGGLPLPRDTVLIPQLLKWI